MATEVLQPQAVTTILGYHLEPERGGATVWCPGTVRDKRRPHEHLEVTVTNIRGHEAEFTVDKQGFAVGPFETSVADVEEDSEFRGQYYQDVVAHMKKVYVRGAPPLISVMLTCLEVRAHPRSCLWFILPADYRGRRLLRRRRTCLMVLLLPRPRTTALVSRDRFLFDRSPLTQRCSACGPIVLRRRTSPGQQIGNRGRRGDVEAVPMGDH